MNAEFLLSLARRFGSAPPFTAADIRAAGLGLELPAQSLGMTLRHAAGRPIELDGRLIELQRAGFQHASRRRWRFVLASPAPAQAACEPGEPDAGSDLL